MANYVYIAASLDGFIAARDGGLDWLMEIPNPDQNDYGFAEFMNGIDALVMGRKTFEKVLSFGEWPYNKIVFVLSRSLTELPEGFDGKAELISGDVKDVIEQLNQQGYQNLYIDGGLTIQSFLKEDCIDELIITRIPILLGNGIPLFAQLDRRLKFKHVKTEVYDNMLVKSHYTRES